MSVVELRFYDGDDPNGSILDTLTEAECSAISLRVALRGMGGGQFSISRSHPSAGSFIRKGNYVRVVIPSIQSDPVWGFWLWEGSFNLLDAQGDDTLTFSGPGPLGILRDAILHEDIFAPGQPRRGNQTIEGYWGWNDIPYGAILTRVIEEGQNQTGTPLSPVTIDFDRDDDSDGNPWPQITNEYRQPIQANVMRVFEDLRDAGDLIVLSDPDFLISAYQTYGTDRTSATFAAGKVRLTDTNILTGLSRKIHASNELTHVLGRDLDGAYFEEVAPGFTGRARWGAIDASETNDATTLSKIGQRTLAISTLNTDAFELEHKPGDDDLVEGRYLPWLHYNVGDDITVDAATGLYAYEDADAQIVAFRVEVDEAADDSTTDTAHRSLHTVIELNAATSDSGPIEGRPVGLPGCHCLELCQTDTVLVPSVAHAAWESNGATAIVVPDDLEDSMLVVFAQAHRGAGGTGPPNTATYGVTPLTAIPGAFADGGNPEMTGFYLLNPPADPTGSGANLVAQDSTANNLYRGYMVIAGVNQADPFGTVVTNTGSGTAAGSGAIAGTGLKINAVYATGASVAAPTAGGGQTTEFTHSTGTFHESGGGSGSANPTWTLSASMAWAAIGIEINGTGATGDEGPFDNVLQGDETQGTSIRASRCDHQHAHGLLCDHGTHYHEADQIHGGGADLTGIDFLVGTASGDLSAEIVVGTTPGGELGGTWASPTVDATHSGSAHHAESHASRHSNGGADEVEVEDLATAETDTDLRLAPDGAGGVEWAAGGGSSGVDVEDEGTPLATTATTLNFTGAGVTASGAGATKTINIPGGGSGGSDDPVDEIFGTATTAFEFDTSSLTGLTTLGSPDVLDADTTVPGHLYVKEAANANHNMVGVYAAIPSYPFTAITKVSDATFFSLDFVKLGGLFITVASPGAMESLHQMHNSGWKWTVVNYTNPTTFNTLVGTDVTEPTRAFPLYYAIVANSSTSFDYWFSSGGRIWLRRDAARNPGFTVANIGLAVNPHQTTRACAAAFDFFRLYNSALTFPGGV